MRPLRPFGIALSLGGLAFFVYAIAKSPQALIETTSHPSFALAVGAATACIFASLLLVTINWHLLLSIFGAGRPLQLTGAIFLVTQIGKFLPGNIGHLVGRAALLKSYDIPINCSAKATVMEVLFVLATGTVLTGILLKSWLIEAVKGLLDTRAENIFAGAEIAAALFAILVLIAGWAANSYRPHIVSFLQITCLKLKTCWSRLVWVVVIDVASFLLNGIALAVSAKLLFPEADLALGSSIGIASASFLAGYVTPGAPGGIGVREATAIFLLSSTTGTTEAATLSLIMRLAATASDLIGFIVGSFVLAHAGPSFTRKEKI